MDSSGIPYFAVVAPLPPTRADDLARPYGIRDVGHVLSDFEAGLLMTAVALANWHARHGFSPVTGQPTAMRDGGWVRRDEAGAEMWPRTDPAVIVLVHDGEPGEDGVCLLGSNAAWSRGRGWVDCPATPAWPASSSRGSRPSRPSSARWPRRSACT